MDGVWRFAIMVVLAIFAARVAADEITLVSGEKLHGTLLEQTDEVVRFEHPVLGELTIPRAGVSAIGVPPASPADAPPPTTAPPVDAPPVEPAAEPPPPPTPGLLGTTFLQGWDRQFELSLNGTEGNTQTMDVRAAFITGMETEFDRMKFAAIYSRASTDSDATRNEFNAELTKDWLFPDQRHFYFASGKYEYDQFKDWEHRVSAFGGIGYEFVKSEKWDLRGRAGIGGNYQFQGDSGFTPEAMLGLETEYRFSDKHKLVGYTTFFPALESPIEFRNVTGAAWQIEIDQDLGLSLKVGVENEYESDASSGEKHNDLKYFAGILWAF